MDADDGMDLLLHAFEQEEDALLFQRWVNGPQYSISFSEFKAALNPPPPKAESEVMEDVKNILAVFQGR